MAAIFAISHCERISFFGFDGVGFEAVGQWLLAQIEYQFESVVTAAQAILEFLRV
jgi:hypothetical protein